MKWQPIETAPMDGELVLVWWPHWNEMDAIIASCTNGFWDCDQRLSFGGPDPTHWMPLPEPPNEQDN